MQRRPQFLVLLGLFGESTAFLLNSERVAHDNRHSTFSLRSSSSPESDTTTATTTAATDDALRQQAEKFKILTCMSTSCCQKRKALGMDSLSTFGAMYSRAGESGVQVEEAPCLGSCQKAPCIGIEHEDFVGCVALEGMTTDEFGAKAFHNIITEEDADRVWSCVEDAIQLMADAEEDEEE